MRFETFLLPLAVSAAVVERQLGGGKVAGIKKLTPEVNPKATRQLTRFGPLTVKGGAKGSDSGQQNWVWTIRDGLCKNCTVLKGKVGLQNIDGSAVQPKNDVYIHHILSFDTTKKSKSFVSGCAAGAAGAVGSKFIGSGEDNNNVPVWYTARDGSHASGFHIGSADSFMMNIDLVSYAPASKQIYLTMDLEYLPGVVGSDARETLLSVTGCGVSSIKISTTGPTNTTSSKYTFVEDGTILAAKGHLHAGGDKMVMYINGKFACESKALYGGAKGENAIDEMSLCTTKGIPVKKGDIMTMMAAYDVSKHPVRHESHGMSSGMADVMGMFDIIFASA